VLATVGLPGSKDLEQARLAAVQLGLPWRGAPLAEEEIRVLSASLDDELGAVPDARRGIFVALAAAIARAPTGRLVCGQGADELFLGYAHYRGLDVPSAAARSASDLETLRSLDWPRTVRIAARWGREIRAPFLDPEFVRAVEGLPVERRLPGALTKPLLRAWARHRGLPESLADRPKRAVQYGTGVERVLRRARPGPD
jgi:asparagine synthase (glutamine-hydrolysing)